MAELRSPDWQAALRLSEMADVAPLDGLWSRWSALVGWCVIEWRQALDRHRLEAQREAVESARAKVW